ncbi:MAG: lipid-binding SYLF domain-containing protein [Magnetovibrio sp.]|nr:lipid-binding SYLF domain-containing protein [Magnetovibrio sp.]
MRRLIAAFTATLLIAVGACTTSEPPALIAKHLIDQAAQTLERFRVHKDLKNYVQHLPTARGLVILPQVVKAGLFAGGEAGNGVLVARTPGGGWSNPTFHTFGAASFGLQVGVQDTAVVLVVRSDGALQSILKHQGKLGADIGASVGVVGVGFEASTTTNVGADVLAFANTNMGAFLGSSLEGGVLAVRRDLNEAFYGAGAKPAAILSGKLVNPASRRLLDALGS